MKTVHCNIIALKYLQVKQLLLKDLKKKKKNSKNLDPDCLLLVKFLSLQLLK